MITLDSQMIHIISKIMDSTPKTLKFLYLHPTADLVEIMALQCFQEQGSRQLQKFQSFMGSQWYNATLISLKRKNYKHQLKWIKMESYLMKKPLMISRLLKKSKNLKGKKISFTKLKKRTIQVEQFRKKTKNNKQLLQAILKIKTKCKNIQNKRKKRENKTFNKKMKGQKE